MRLTCSESSNSARKNDFESLVDVVFKISVVCIVSLLLFQSLFTKKADILLKVNL
jgi:hypothetical protein